jgi:hypothetical protein
LHAAEQTLIAYYRTTAKGDAVEHLDGLRTLLGNEAGQIAADMSPPKFCALYRDRVAQFDAATSADIDNHIRRMELFVRSYARPCGKTAGTKKKG